MLLSIGLNGIVSGRRGKESEVSAEAIFARLLIKGNGNDFGRMVVSMQAFLLIYILSMFPETT